MKETIRVALIDLPRLMREIVEREFAQLQDFEMVAADTSMGWREVAMLRGPDVIILGAGTGSERSTSSMLDLWPHAEVLVVSGGGRDATFVHLEPRRTELGHLDAHEIVTAIRAKFTSRFKGKL